MFSVKLLCATVLSYLLSLVHQPNPDLDAEWDLYYGAHQYWMGTVYRRYSVSDVHQVLNIEPAIDHVDHYGTRIPDYFRATKTLEWVSQNFKDLGERQEAAVDMVNEIASVYAADAMCHPRDRVGRFDWSDVLRLHQSLRTPYLEFFRAHGQGSTCQKK